MVVRRRLAVCRYMGSGGVSRLNENKQLPMRLLFLNRVRSSGYGTADNGIVSRKKGFIGNSQLEENRFSCAKHHTKIMHNGNRRARAFYKNRGGLQFVQKTSSMIQRNRSSVSKEERKC